MTRLPVEAHAERPWRIHEITADFRVEDVWALATPGGPDDFPELIRVLTTLDPERSSPAPVRALWALRWKLGALLGWDDERAGLGERVPSLRARLPADLREAPVPPARGSLPFVPLYERRDEYAAEIANDTVHGVLHLGWVPDEETGAWRGQLAVLVKPNGRLGAAYMAAIMPFRHLLVYPAMLRAIERAWVPPAGR